MASIFIFFILFKTVNLPENFILVENQKEEDYFYKSLTIKIKKGEKEFLEGDYFKNKNKNSPLIIFFPILGPFDPSKLLATIFMFHFKFKVDILILSQKRYIFWRKADSIENINDLIKILKSMNENSFLRLKALSIFINYLKQKGRAKKIGIIGISYGGIEGIVFALRYKKVNCIAIVNGGGNISKIIIESCEPEIKKSLKKIKEKLKISDEELEKMLSKNLKELEPLNLNPKISTERILFVSSFSDKTVPYKYQKILWEHLGKPERILTPYGHRGVIFYFFKIISEIFKLFDKNLN